MHKNRGFTLIELVVAMLVIGLLTASVLIFSRSGNAEASLMRSAERLMLDISRQQSNALSSREFKGEIPCGYGVYFSAGATSYILFDDLDEQNDLNCAYADRSYSNPADPQAEEFLSKTDLENGIQISGATAPNIVFVPPMPAVYFDRDVDQAEITLKSDLNGTQRTVVVTKAGRIYIK